VNDNDYIVLVTQKIYHLLQMIIIFSSRFHYLLYKIYILIYYFNPHFLSFLMGLYASSLVGYDHGYLKLHQPAVKSLTTAPES
jgi:hypothetical protein